MKRVVPPSAGRSFTDPLTNTTLVSDDDFPDLMAALLDDKLPRRMAPTIIHETTHHWCLVSPVGNTLSLLQLRAARLAITAFDGEVLDPSEDLVWDVFDSWLRCEMLLAWLRPILEGLAIFMEADVRPGESPVGTPITFLTARYFARAYFPASPPPAADRVEAIQRAVTSFLLQMRLGREYLLRKESILAEPIGDVRNGYLASYLFVKDLWTAAAYADERMFDTELFAMVLRCYLFFDYELVGHLLDPGTRDLGAVQAIGDHLSTRLEALVYGFDEFTDLVIESAMVTPLYVEPSTETSFDLGEDEFARRLSVASPSSQVGQTRYESEWKALVDESSGSPGGYATRDLWTMSQREMFGLGQVEVQVRVSPEGGHVYWQGDRLLMSHARAAAVAPLPPGLHTATVGAYLFPYRGFVGLAATVDGSVVMYNTYGEPSQLLSDHFGQLALDLRRVVEHSSALKDFVEAFILEDDFIESIVETSRTTVLRWYDELFVQRLFPRLDSDRREAVMSSLNLAGLGSALGGRDELRQVTWLSLAAGFSQPTAVTESWFDQDRWFHGCTGSLSECIDAVTTRCSERLDDPLIYRSGEIFWSAV